MIEQLAGSLATQVAAQLGVPVETARAKLTAAFTQALAPTGSGPPQTNAERASTLATRFRQIAELATRVTNEAGQPIRTIAGTSLDAVTAGANPTPQSSTPASPDHATASQPSPDPVPATAAILTAATSPAPAGDGLVVPIEPAQAIASGGDTLLGRMLARATLAETSSSVEPQAPKTASVSHASASNATTTTTTAAATATAPTTVSTPAVDAFLNAFSAALAQNDAPRQASSVAEQTKDDVAPLPAASSTASPSAPPPFAIAIAPDASPIAPPVPVSTMPQAQPVDPQAVIDQIVRGMSINTGDGQSTVKLRLVPENLGDVSVKLTVSGGTVSASITAHTADAQNAIVAGQPQLAKTLADAGLKLQSFNVSLAGNPSAGGNSDQRQQQSGSNSSSTRKLSAVADDDDTDELDLLAGPTFGPPIYTASRGLGALNYLV